MKNTTYSYSIYHPNGNDTALVKGLIDDPQLKNKINRLILQKHPNIEQVGFIDEQRKELQMAGDEFCGNATRCAIYEFLHTEQGNIKISSSGLTNKIEGGTNADLETWVTFNEDFIIESIQLAGNMQLIRLQGISHVITPLVDEVSPNELKKQALQILSKYKLLHTAPAVGVMFTKEHATQIELHPVVYVGKTQTLYYESACGSGTAAVAYSKASNNNEIKIEYLIKQPSKEDIRAILKKTNEKLSITISGKVAKIIDNATITI